MVLNSKLSLCSPRACNRRLCVKLNETKSSPSKRISSLLGRVFKHKHCTMLRATIAARKQAISAMRTKPPRLWLTNWMVNYARFMCNQRPWLDKADLRLMDGWFLLPFLLISFSLEKKWINKNSIETMNKKRRKILMRCKEKMSMLDDTNEQSTKEC